MPKRDESGQGGGPEEQEQPSLDLESMSGDLVKLLKTMFPNRDEAPGLILVGHSMVSFSVFLFFKPLVLALFARFAAGTDRRG